MSSPDRAAGAAVASDTGAVLAMFGIGLLMLVFLPMTILLAAFFLTKDFAPGVAYRIGRAFGWRWAQ